VEVQSWSPSPDLAWWCMPCQEVDVLARRRGRPRQGHVVYHRTRQHQQCRLRLCRPRRLLPPDRRLRRGRLHRHRHPLSVGRGPLDGEGAGVPGPRAGTAGGSLEQHPPAHHAREARSAGGGAHGADAGVGPEGLALPWLRRQPRRPGGGAVAGSALVLVRTGRPVPSPVSSAPAAGVNGRSPHGTSGHTALPAAGLDHHCLRLPPESGAWSETYLPVAETAPAGCAR
jgi:hypothetical protein